MLLRMTVRRAPLSFRTAVRNLRSPSNGQPVTATSHRMSSTLDSSSCAPQNDMGREGRAPRNGNDGEEGRRASG